MSNHDGGEMLKGVLELLDKYKFYENLGKDQTLSFIKNVIEIANGWDCNTYEVLGNIGIKLRICHYCMKYGDDIDEEGFCTECV